MAHPTCILLGGDLISQASTASTSDISRSTSSESLSTEGNGDFRLTLDAALSQLVDYDGNGQWPPKVSYESAWPKVLQVYAKVAREAPSRFVLKRAILDHAVKFKRIRENREWITGVFQDTPLDEVIDALTQLAPSARSGFLACVAYLSHLYRWGTLPVVSEAQAEIDLVFPDVLSHPLRRLNQFYGIETSGGCLYSMTLCNVDLETEQKIVFSNMAHLGGDEANAEKYNAVLFYEIERRVYPFYQSLARVAELAGKGEFEEAAIILRSGNKDLASAFNYFFNNLRQGVVNKEVWMSHAQGFHGWNLNNEEGVSGDQSLLIRTLDAFLGIPLVTQPTGLCPMSVDALRKQPEVMPSLSNRAYNWLSSWFSTTTISSEGRTTCPRRRISEIEYSTHHLPHYSRQWIETVRSSQIRHKSKGTPLEVEIDETLRLFRMWRLGHIKKALYYEDLDLPERRPMTAGGGQGAQSTVQDMIAALRARLSARISATY